MNKFTYLNTSINPNLSQTNLHKLGGKLHQPKPVKFSQFQLPSPPVSKVNLPVERVVESKWKLVISNYKVILLCANWYVVSIFSSNLTKIILNNYKFPVILTQLQFILNCILCVVLLFVVRYKNWEKHFPVGVIPTDLSEFKPNRLIVTTTLPMGIFQFVGHITSHKATSLIQVSFVHTIKALSPMATILIYRVFFNQKIKLRTYYTLLPLVLGIMLACYKPGADFSYAGFIYSMISMIIFVSQNIYSKKSLTIESKTLPSNLKAEKKLDKLVILFYCSLIGFCFTLPTYLFQFDKKCLSWNWTIIAWILFNGLSHFAQSLLAFQILNNLSPINYSIANIFKRIIIIVVAFCIEGKKLGGLQGVGLVLTMAGLYGYDRWGK